VKKLFFVGLINDVTKVGLEWIVCAKDQVWQCHFELMFLHSEHIFYLV
jgi:hypothetical protein